MNTEIHTDAIESDLMAIVLRNIAIPLAQFFGIVVIGWVLFKFVASLYVSGNANEWVLILNNGKMKSAGVGLTCFKGPFDQVAKFPS